MPANNIENLTAALALVLHKIREQPDIINNISNTRIKELANRYSRDDMSLAEDIITSDSVDLETLNLLCKALLTPGAYSILIENNVEFINSMIAAFYRLRDHQFSIDSIQNQEVRELAQDFQDKPLLPRIVLNNALKLGNPYFEETFVPLIIEFLDSCLSPQENQFAQASSAVTRGPASPPIAVLSPRGQLFLGQVYNTVEGAGNRLLGG